MRQWNRHHAVTAKQFFSPNRTQFLQRFVALENLNRHSRPIPIHLRLFTALFFSRIIVFLFLLFFSFCNFPASFAEHIDFLYYPPQVDRQRFLFFFFNVSPILHKIPPLQPTPEPWSSSILALFCMLCRNTLAACHSQRPAYKIQKSFCRVALPPLLQWEEV